MATSTIPPDPAQPAPTTVTRTQARIRARPLLIGLGVLIVLAVAARFGYTYYVDSTIYVSTDDALVDSNLVPVAPLASGTLVIWRIKPGDKVRAGQVLGQVKTTTGSAYIDESAIHKVHPGQQVDVTVDATGRNVYHGSVSEILPATASSFALIPSSDRSNSNFTKVTQRIEVHIDIGSTSGTALYPGENAYVRIRTA